MNKKGEAECLLCPHLCRMPPGHTGKCGVRRHINGQLFSLNYGLISALCTDPIEKKSLYHFFPGHQILSVGSFGCNFRCGWCQNATISQCCPDDFGRPEPTPPGVLLESAGKSGGIGLAYTYNEPTVWFEYMLDSARQINDRGMKNVVVSNGYINREPLEELMEVVHAFNIDLKAFDRSFYRRETGGKLQPVKESLKAISRKGIHLEITYLVIPGLNHDALAFEGMIEWIQQELGPETILHLSRYFPARKMQQPPTPAETMQELYHTARQRLPYVYLGNMPASQGGTATRCPDCEQLVIERTGYRVSKLGMDASGKCTGCSKSICIMS